MREHFLIFRTVAYLRLQTANTVTEQMLNLCVSHIYGLDIHLFMMMSCQLHVATALSQGTYRIEGRESKPISLSRGRN